MNELFGDEADREVGVPCLKGVHVEAYTFERLHHLDCETR